MTIIIFRLSRAHSLSEVHVILDVLDAHKIPLPRLVADELLGPAHLEEALRTGTAGRHAPGQPDKSHSYGVMKGWGATFEFSGGRPQSASANPLPGDEAASRIVSLYDAGDILVRLTTL